MYPNLEGMHCTWVDEMDIKVLEEKENKFFNRREFKVLVQHATVATPSKAELIKILAQQYNADENQIQIDYLFSKKGIAESIAKFKILKDKPKAEKKVEKVEAQDSQSE